MLFNAIKEYEVYELYQSALDLFNDWCKYVQLKPVSKNPASPEAQFALKHWQEQLSDHAQV